VDVKGWGNQEQKRICARKFAAGEGPELLELAASVMPLHAGPVVETLQRQVDIFVGFEFDDSQAIVAGGGEHVERSYVADHQRLKPALRMQAKKLVMMGTLRAARGAQAVDQVIEDGGIAFVEDALFGADAEGNLLAAAKGGWFMANAGAGELQAMPTEGNFGGGKDGGFAFGQAAEHLVNRVGEAIEGRSFVGTADQAGVDVAAVGEIELG
jgi:hypothetical protein